MSIEVSRRELVVRAAAASASAWCVVYGQREQRGGVAGVPQRHAPTMVFDVQRRVETKPQEAEMRLRDGVL